MKNYEQELLRKKRKAEELLAEEIRDRNWYAARVGVGGTERPESYDPNKANMENCDIVIEALQNFIEGIDSYLREKSY